MIALLARAARRSGLPGLFLGLLSCLAIAGEPCRVVFDMGSSGIRAGASTSRTSVSTEVDYLGAWWATHSLKGAEEQTVAALRDLPRLGGFAADCQKVGGGFSAWRLAAQANADELADLLARIRLASGVAVLVIPQRQEGAYGYSGSREMMGDRLATTHVLDIGGGSLQIAGERTSFGDALGQKIWHRELCRKLRNAESATCGLQPLSETEVAAARSLVQDRLKAANDALAGPVTLTAISRPVSRGILPALKHLAAEGVDPSGFKLTALANVIDRLAPKSLDEIASISGNGPSHAAYLISDMLLVEGLLRATSGTYLNVAEIDLTNIPGLLNDTQAFAWEQRYDCYLDRLRRLGVPAYDSEPAACPR